MLMFYNTYYQYVHYAILFFSYSICSYVHTVTGGDATVKAHRFLPLRYISAFFSYLRISTAA